MDPMEVRGADHRAKADHKVRATRAEQRAQFISRHVPRGDSPGFFARLRSLLRHSR